MSCVHPGEFVSRMPEIALVVPYFNHQHAIAQTVACLAATGMRCWLINDGSSAAATALVNALAARESNWLTVLNHAQNRGKGAAVMTGFRAAFEAGATHALQIDADGQHDFRDIPRMARLCCEHPRAIISGTPIFDASVPAARRLGRKLTNFWVAINTLSSDSGDAMCGFRVYPLAAITRLVEIEPVGLRMDFDPEILVRARWHGIQVIEIKTSVTYPADGVSHFRMLRDNVRISWMHTRLFFGMLLRLPRLLGQRRRERMT
jgi:glycosyltransferase involved in cell wall biosynthesis